MKAVKILFREDPSADGIDITISAKERDRQVEELIEKLSDSNQSFTVYDAERKVYTITSDDIILISSADSKVNIITRGGSYFTNQSLQALEKTLDSTRFMRISRFEIVNIDKVSCYDFTTAGTLRLELTGGMETWASRRCIPEIRRLLKGKE